MIKDPIIEDVRRIRKAIEAECGDNEEDFFRHILEAQKQYKGRLVRRKKRIVKVKKTA